MTFVEHFLKREDAINRSGVLLEGNTVCGLIAKEGTAAVAGKRKIRVKMCLALNPNC